MRKKNYLPMTGKMKANKSEGPKAEKSKENHLYNYSVEFLVIKEEGMRVKSLEILAHHFSIDEECIRFYVCEEKKERMCAIVRNWHSVREVASDKVLSSSEAFLKEFS